MKCQCGANAKGNFCEYCGADLRTPFERKVDKVAEVSNQVMGHVKPVAKTMLIVWVIVAVISLIIFAVVAVAIANAFSGFMGFSNNFNEVMKGVNNFGNK